MTTFAKLASDLDAAFDEVRSAMSARGASEVETRGGYVDSPSSPLAFFKTLTKGKLARLRSGGISVAWTPARRGSSARDTRAYVSHFSTENGRIVETRWAVVPGISSHLPSSGIEEVMFARHEKHRPVYAHKSAGQAKREYHVNENSEKVDSYRPSDVLTLERG